MRGVEIQCAEATAAKDALCRNTLCPARLCNVPNLGSVEWPYTRVRAHRDDAHHVLHYRRRDRWLLLQQILPRIQVLRREIAVVLNEKTGAVLERALSRKLRVSVPFEQLVRVH